MKITAFYPLYVAVDLPVHAKLGASSRHLKGMSFFVKPNFAFHIFAKFGRRSN